MKDCIKCKAIHDEVGDICRVCQVYDKNTTTSLAYRNMQKGKRVHPCYYCKRLTPDEDGTLCKECKIKDEKPTEEQMGYWECSNCKKSIDKRVGLCDTCTKQKEKTGTIIPTKVNWEVLGWLAINTTFISLVISAVLYFIDFIWITRFLLNLLLSPNFSYYLRIPAFFPFFFLSLGLGLHLLSKFYYGGFFTPITNIWRSIKINLERLSLSVKIRWNAFISRKRAIQAYKRKRAESYEGWKGEIKLEEPLLDDKATREYVRLNRAEPNLEEVQQQ